MSTSLGARMFTETPWRGLLCRVGTCVPFPLARHNLNKTMSYNIKSICERKIMSDKVGKENLIALRLNNTQMRAIKAFAKQHNASVSEVIRISIENMIPEAKR